MGVNIAQYAEAKVLSDDAFVLERKVEEQRLEIESLKMRLTRAVREKDMELKKIKKANKKKMNLIQLESEKVKLYNEKSFVLVFSDIENYQAFEESMKRLAKKHNLESLEMAILMCVHYTLHNDKLSFFLHDVTGFFKNY